MKNHKSDLIRFGVMFDVLSINFLLFIGYIDLMVNFTIYIVVPVVARRDLVIN